MGKVLGIVNRKGGVGKTTTATTLSYLLSKEGCKVALIDFDGQRHTTKLCGVTAPEQLSVTIYDILKCIVMNEELPDKESYMIRTETGVDLIPANNKLDNFDKLMCDTDFAEYKLKEFVDTIKEQYDYILIDGMPKMGTAMINVMICCDSLIIPVQSETLAVEGMAEFLRAFHRIKSHANARLEIEGILITMDNERTRVSKRVKAQLQQALGEKVRIFTNSIPRSIKVPEAVEYGMDDLFDFKTKEDLSQPEQENGGTGITEMDFAVMEPLPNHKFKLYTGQRLQDMVDSIREFGILEPLIVWVHEGKNTILSGHNRQNAGSIAGLTKGPVIIRENLTYEDAVLIATETNLRQRSFDDLSPSEKAYCLKQHYDAIKSQGRRNDLIKEIEELVNPHEIGENGTSLENPKKSDAGAAVSEEYGLSKDRIARYLRIATLITPLLDCLDAKTLGFEAAYDISFVKEEMQPVIAELIVNDNCRIDTKKSTLIHDYAKKGKLTEELLRQIITGEKTKAARSGSPKPIKIKETVINRFFGREQSRKEIEDTIVKALEFYFAQNSENPEQKVG